MTQQAEAARAVASEARRAAEVASAQAYRTRAAAEQAQRIAADEVASRDVIDHQRPASRAWRAGACCACSCGTAGRAGACGCHGETAGDADRRPDLGDVGSDPRPLAA